MKNQAFIQQLNEATELEISELLGILKNQYEKIPSHLRGNFNNLKQEFIDQPNNFALGKWKARMITLIREFDFEIAPEDNNNQVEGKTSTQNTSQTAHTIINIGNINTANFNEKKDKED
jgi:hypothetical protein